MKRESPWPTADGYRFSLLAWVQIAESVHLRSFFAKLYPEAVTEHDESVSGQPEAPPAERREADHG